MIEVICQYPSNVVMGIFAGIGALANAGFTVYVKSKEDKKFEFDVTRILDTAWQSVVAGAIAGTSLGCGWIGILTAMVTGVGVDKIANKMKVSETQVLNIVQLIGTWLQNRKKK